MNLKKFLIFVTILVAGIYSLLLYDAYRYNNAKLELAIANLSFVESENKTGPVYTRYTRSSCLILTDKVAEQASASVLKYRCEHFSNRRK